MQAWLPTRGWAGGHTITDKLGEYRFDDPAGEVGVETILWTTEDGSVLQTPLTYRAAPLGGADQHLVGTAEHTALGRRWVYDGCADPVWAATLTTAIVTGGTQAQMYLEENGERVDVPARMSVRGSGTPGTDVPPVTSSQEVVDNGTTTRVRAGAVELIVPRAIGTQIEAKELLTGEVDGRSVHLAGLRHA